MDGWSVEGVGREGGWDRFPLVITSLDPGIRWLGSNPSLATYQLDNWTNDSHHYAFVSLSAKMGIVTISTLGG